MSSICSLFGGRIAEEMVLGADGITTGASNDIERATSLARNMVTKWGLSEKLGPLKYDEDDDQPFLGRSASSRSLAVSEATARKIDEEVRVIIDDCYGRAKTLLETHSDKLHAMADALMEYETLNSDQINDIMEGMPPRPPEDPNNRRPPSAPEGSDAATGASPDPAVGGSASG